MITFFPSLSGPMTLAVDTETTGLRYRHDIVFGLAVACTDQSWYFDLREQPQAVAWFNDMLDATSGEIIMHNAQFDCMMLDTSGFAISKHLHRVRDTMVLGSLLNEHETSYSLDNLATVYLGDHKEAEIYDDLAKLFGGKAIRSVQMPNLHRAPSVLVAPYAKKDVELTLRLWQQQQLRLSDDGTGAPPLSKVAEFEWQVLPVLIANQLAGVRVDVELAVTAAQALTIDIDDLQLKLNKLCGFEVNPNSHDDVMKVFQPRQNVIGDWVMDDGNKLFVTGEGKPAFGAGTLRSLNHPAALPLLELRSLLKTRDTFLIGHVISNATNGRVYPQINQNRSDTGGTATGRLSYQGPALQQIPAKNAQQSELIRRIFLPEEGQVWVEADMHSFEVRVFVHLINNEQLINRYREDPATDAHQYVADLTGLPRSSKFAGQPNAKQLNLSMIFNAGNGKIADEMGLSWSWDEFVARTGETVRYRKAGPEAMQIINRYHKVMPGVKELAARARRTIEQRGFIYTRSGRRIRLTRDKAYKASGLLIQATAADINKEAWIKGSEVAKQFGGRLLLNVHDSYSFSLPVDQLEPAFAAIRTEIETVPDFKVPLVLEQKGTGFNWWEASQ